MVKNIGFIGCGSMAKAIIGGMVQSGLIQSDSIYASNRSIQKLLDIKEQYDIHITQNNLSVAEVSDILFLSVTPDMYPHVIAEIKDYLKDDALVVSIAAGLTIEQCEKLFGTPIKLVKAMPNTPVLVGEGMTALSFNQHMTDEDTKVITDIFESFSKVEVIHEQIMDIASAISGSSPAFVYLFIEALADGAVMYGMPREKAYKFAAQTVLGSAKMVLESGLHPGQLKDDVCSPGGTTIQSIASLEENGFRSAIIQAVKANIGKMEQ